MRTVHFLILSLLSPAGAAADGSAPPDDGGALGWREVLRARGLELGAGLTADWSQVLDGGIERDGRGRLLASVEAAYDAEPLLGWRGLTAFAQGIWQEGDDASAELVGDLQAFDNLDAPDRTQLYELWVQLVAGPWRGKVGRIDANSEFAAADTAAVLLNSSFGFSPTILAFPSYIDPAFAAIVAHEQPRWSLRLGIFDGAGADGVPTGSRGPSTVFSDARSDAWFGIAEAGVDWGHEHPGRIAIGVWRHSAEFPRLDGMGSEDGTVGLYALLEQRLWNDGAGSRALDAVVQFGRSDDALAEMHRHVGIALVLQAPLAERPDDQLFVGLSSVALADDLRTPSGHETALEIGWLVELAPWWQLTIDLQHIRHPGGAEGDATVATVRSAWTF